MEKTMTMDKNAFEWFYYIYNKFIFSGYIFGYQKLMI